MQYTKPLINTQTSSSLGTLRVKVVSVQHWEVIPVIITYHTEYCMFCFLDSPLTYAVGVPALLLLIALCFSPIVCMRLMNKAHESNIKKEKKVESPKRKHVVKAVSNYGPPITIDWDKIERYESNDNMRHLMKVAPDDIEMFEEQNTINDHMNNSLRVAPVYSSPRVKVHPADVEQSYDNDHINYLIKVVPDDLTTRWRADTYDNIKHLAKVAPDVDKLDTDISHKTFEYNDSVDDDSSSEMGESEASETENSTLTESERTASAVGSAERVANSSRTGSDPDFRFHNNGTALIVQPVRINKKRWYEGLHDN
eukprot:CAMPEP_0182440410 /NCGR_PEP_ID=MMETSP1167-20130531/87048_1 /TAXON_ID=2988 /ORGANISM="Mallomonas Sp, Strain CCMP3275" /LENGTH=310 /DNA_ID=CAMNT_0024634361 /DNA_START=2981 /DNA_END=3913 /DNA_ORIENTATION=-